VKNVGGLRPKNHSTVLMYMNTSRNEHTPTQKMENCINHKCFKNIQKLPVTFAADNKADI